MTWLFTKKAKRSLVKQYKAVMRGDIPVIGRYDPIIDFALTARDWRPL